MLPRFMKFAVLVFLFTVVSPAEAGIVSIANPGAADEVLIRIRWGGTNFEAAIYDVSPVTATAVLDPTGSPAWVVGSAYAFEISYSAATGSFGLAIDFNLDNSFGAGETISNSTFSAPGLTNYAGDGFRYLSIRANESGSSGLSQLTSLDINGTALPNMVPGGAVLQNYYADSGLATLAPILISGKLTYLNTGVADERPVWDFYFKSPQPVPEPTSLALCSLGLGAIVARWRRRTI